MKVSKKTKNVVPADVVTGRVPYDQFCKYVNNLDDATISFRDFFALRRLIVYITEKGDNPETVKRRYNWRRQTQRGA